MINSIPVFVGSALLRLVYLRIWCTPTSTCSLHPLVYIDMPIMFLYWLLLFRCKYHEISALLLVILIPLMIDCQIPRWNYTIPTFVDDTLFFAHSIRWGMIVKIPYVDCGRPCKTLIFVETRIVVG